VHLSQVHKETLTQIENALPNRQGVDVEIFGMEGIPADIFEQHRARIVQNYYQAQKDRQMATGNVQPQNRNAAGGNPVRKKARVETEEEIKERVRKYREMMRERKAAGLEGVSL